jgi:hypothetical protein
MAPDKGACVESWCTRALIYANGHVLDDEAETLPAKNARFCPQCLGVPGLPAPDVGHRSATSPGSPIFAQQLLRHMTKQQLLKDSDHHLSRAEATTRLCGSSSRASEGSVS